MEHGFLATRGLRSAEAEVAGAEARRLGVAYVLQCPAYAGNIDRTGLAPESLQRRLDAGRPPSWLRRVDDGRGALQLYAVRPATARESR
jgi:hypothetical protein